MREPTGVTVEPRDGRRDREADEIALRLARAIATLAAGSEARMTAPVPEHDLDRIERALDHPLPEELRTMLRALGAGLYEQGHEVLGPTRVMIHDIEIVPDMLSVRARLAAEGGLEPGLVPFHRVGGRVHLVRASGPRSGEVVSIPEGAIYPHLAAFIEQVLLAPSTPADPTP
jgi:hypothetical protein